MIYIIGSLFSFLLAYTINPSSKSPVYAIFILAFTFQYSVAFAAFFLNYDNIRIYATWEYRFLALFVICVAFIAACIVLSSFGHRPSITEKLTVQYGQLNTIVAALSVVGVFLLAGVTDLANYSERLMSRAGGGFVYIFGFLTFGAALNFALFPPGKRPKWSWFVLVSAIMFFSIAGYRSFVMFCLLALVLSFFGISVLVGRLKFALFVATLTIFAVPINFISGSARSLLSSQHSEISFDSVVELAHTLYKEQPVPIANGHLDILAVYLQTASSGDKSFGTASTLLASITNFIPRTLFPEKGETTGVIIARQIFPEWFYSGTHTSSATVGLIFEMIFNFGIPLGILFFVVLIALSCRLFNILIQIPIYGYYFSPLLAWCLFFNIFFDDLGGALNKLVSIFIGAALVIVFHQLWPGRPVSRHGAS